MTSLNVITLWQARLDHLMQAEKYKAVNLWDEAERETKQAEQCKIIIQSKEKRTQCQK